MAKENDKPIYNSRNCYGFIAWLCFTFSSI